MSSKRLLIRQRGAEHSGKRMMKSCYLCYTDREMHVKMHVQVRGKENLSKNIYCSHDRLLYHDTVGQLAPAHGTGGTCQLACVQQSPKSNLMGDGFITNHILHLQICYFESMLIVLAPSTDSGKNQVTPE